MTDDFNLYPVPNPPPGEGERHICEISDNWIPILIGQMERLRDPLEWLDPPAEITQQVDEFIQEIIKDYVPVAYLATNYFHVHANSRVITGSAIAALVEATHEMATVWRQTPTAVNDETFFEAWLDIGSYNFDICHAKSSASGMLTTRIVGEPFTGWVTDFYNAATQFNRHTVLPFDVTIAGLKRISLKAASKNAASGGYAINITYVSIKKIG